MSVLHSDSRIFRDPSLCRETTWDEGGCVDQIFILQKAFMLASENRVKEALDSFSVALQYGPVRPQQLSALVDSILRNSSGNTPSDSCSGDSSAVFTCPSCRGFLCEPVTVACGHSYCKRCLRRHLISKCTLCQETTDAAIGTEKVGTLKPNVILNYLLEKWFPAETKRCKVIGEIEDLSRRRLFDKALALANEVIESGPGDMLALAYRAEAYAGLGSYESALNDLEVLCESSPHWPEGYFRKGNVLRKMGHVDDALQVFLHCLALDADFILARKEVEKILYDLLLPASADARLAQQVADLSSSSCLPRKMALVNTQVQASPPSLLDQKEDCDVPPPPPALGELRLRSSTLLLTPQDQDLPKRKLPVSAEGRSKLLRQEDATVPSRGVPRELLEASDFECSLCIRLFYEPVTTPCGHTFCRSCLERCLDHAPQCPLCKDSLREFLASKKFSVTPVLETLMKTLLPEEYLERLRSHSEEMEELSNSLRRGVPMFICTMAYPTVPCPLHVFEPRYRLMVRRCLETGTRCFGMCISDPQKGFVDYGCMLQIRCVHFLPDGRSVVDTVGGERFRVLARGMRDGYHIADIEYLEDVKVTDAEEMLKLQELHDQVYRQAHTWFGSLEPRFRDQILQHFGPMPAREIDIQATANGPACCWWLLAVLPVDPRYQLSVLSLLSLRERLLKIQQILTYLQNVPDP
nr:LON peptidase N-terminal domain and RING finger protein 1-like isoform X1 [Paramormyrops kingsleyae]